MNRQTFTRTGNAPDLGALSTPVRTAIGDPFYLAAQLSLGGTVTIVVDKPTAWQAGEITAVQTAVNAAADRTAQTDAQNQIDQMPIFEKAILLTLLDEINVIRTTAALGLAARTPGQAITAVRNKAATL
jgi:hypothetical protein